MTTETKPASLFGPSVRSCARVSRHSTIQLCAMICAALLAHSALAAVPDSDGDGVLDNADNCQLVANANQRDTDNDGFGNICDADLNNNGIVNALDLGIFKSAFFSTPASAHWNPHADFNGDNVVNALDLGRIKLMFFLPPGPVAYARWNVNSSGNWSNPANWFPVAIPSATSHVLIDRPVAVTVTYDAAAGNRTVASVVSNNMLVLAGGELTVLDTIQVNNTFNLAGGWLRSAHVLAGTGGQGVTAPESTYSYLDGVTLAANAVIQNGALVYVDNGLTLDGANITLASTDAYAYLVFQGTQTLGGTGELRFGGTTTYDYTNWVYPSSGTLTVGPGITTRTLTAGGQLGYPYTGMTLNGPVVSNLAGSTVTVAGNLLDIQAPLTGSNGGSITIDGNWSNANGNTISVTGGDLRLHGTWNNAGNIAATNGNVVVGQSSTWSSSGTITFTNAPATLAGMLTVANLFSVTSDSSLVIVGNLLNTGNTLDLDLIPATVSLGSGARITGGTLTGSGAFTVPPSVYIYLDGVTLATDMSIENGAQVYVDNGLTLDGANITLASTDAYAYLVFQGTQTLGGTGELRFGGTTTYDYTNWVYPSSGTLTVGPGITTRTLTAGGQLGYPYTGMTLNGPVVSNLAGSTVTVAGNLLDIQAPLTGSNGGSITIDGNWSNANGNTISVTGGDLRLHGTWNNAGNIAATNGNVVVGQSSTWSSSGTITFTNAPATLAGMLTVANLFSVTSDSSLVIVGNLLNTGNTLDLDLIPATVSLGSGARITGGTLTGSGAFTVPPSVYIYLDGLTLATDMSIENGAQVYVDNGLTLDGANITLASTDAYAYLVFQGTQTLGGTGELRFGGTTTYDYTNWVYPSSGTLTVGPGITTRAVTAGGQLGYPYTGLLMRGALIADLPGRDVYLEGSSLIVEGSLTAGAQSHIRSSSTTLQLTATAALDLDIGPAGNGVLVTTGDVQLAGTLNLALVGGLTPAACSAYELLSYATHSGAFAFVNGPDIGGDTFDLVAFASRLDAVTPGIGCNVNHAELAGATAVASSQYSAGYEPALAIDGVDSTSSSWCTANNDANPSITVTLPASTTLTALAVLTSYSPSYDFLTGRFIARNAANATVYDSGPVALTAGEISHDVVPDTANVRSVQFIGLTWNSIEPCLAELQLFAPLP